MDLLGTFPRQFIEGLAGQQEPSDEAVEFVMEPGPTTLRPNEPAKALLERMKKKKVPAVIVTTNNGRLVGAVTQQALERLVLKS